MSSPPTALVHDWLTGMRGGEKVLEALLPLFPGAPIHTLLHVPGSVSAAIEAHPIVTSYLQRAPEIRRHYRRYLPFFPSAIEDFDLTAYRLVVSSSHCVAKGAIPAPDAFHICYCHTPMRYAWDQEHAYFPRRRGVGARLRGWALTRLRQWDAASTPRVDVFVANSRFVARRIHRYYGRDAEVIPPPVDTEFFHPRQAADAAGEPPASPTQPYALMVAALAPYKKVEVAIRACEGLGLPLVVVGTGPELAALRRVAKGDTQFPGRVSPERLRTLYRGALCLLQPGTEDFGIAPVEALASGTPVVARAQGGVLDIVENGQHGVLYEPPESAGTDEAQRAAEVAALAAAVDSCRQMRFNIPDLVRHAESFSMKHFVDRFRSLLGERAPEHLLG